MLAGWRPTILTKRFICPCHINKQITTEIELDLECVYDISKGQESSPITMESVNNGNTTRFNSLCPALIRL